MAFMELGIKTKVDLQGVEQLKKSLAELKTTMADPEGHFLSAGLKPEEVQKTTQAVHTLEKALTSAYNVKLNSIDTVKFNQELKKSNMNVTSLYKDLSRLGAEGQSAFLRVAQANLTFGKSVHKTNKLVQDMKETMANTVRWGISSSIWNKMLEAVSQAFTYVKGLDKDLNDIRIVTGKSADQMERFAKQANKAAKDLAVSTRDYTQGALIYYQQGLSDKEVETRTNITAKASNITGQDMSTVSEQLTAVWNGYQVANQAAKEGMDVYERYVDKMTAVAASTASDLEEQATAMSKVASAAYSMGVGFDELNAQISTIVSVTRQAPESVGTALKTIYARLGDLQVDGVDEFGVSLGDVSGKLQTMGIEVMDSNGQMREMDEVMTEVAAKWDTWTDAQKQAAAVAMAGKRQYNNLIALFDNWDMYGESLKTSMESAGTLSEQQSIALDSLENKMEKMQTSAEKFYDALFDEQSVGGLVDGLTTIVDLLGSLTQGLGGLKTILPLVGGMMLKFFSKDIANSLTDSFQQSALIAKNLSDDKAKSENAYQYGKEHLYLREDTKGMTEKEKHQYKLGADQSQKMVNLRQQFMPFKSKMTDEQLNRANIMMDNQVAAGELVVKYREQEENLLANNMALQISNEKKEKYLKLQQMSLEIEKNEAEYLQKKQEKQDKIKQLEEDAVKVQDKLYQQLQDKEISYTDQYMSEEYLERQYLDEDDLEQRRKYKEELEKINADIRKVNYSATGEKKYKDSLREYEKLSQQEDFKKDKIDIETIEKRQVTSKGLSEQFLNDYPIAESSATISTRTAVDKEIEGSNAQQISAISDLVQKKDLGQGDEETTGKIIEEYSAALKKLKEEGKSTEEVIEEMIDIFEDDELSPEDFEKIAEAMENEQKAAKKLEKQLEKTFDDFIEENDTVKELLKDNEDLTYDLRKRFVQLTKSGKTTSEAFKMVGEELGASSEQMTEVIQKYAEMEAAEKQAKEEQQAFQEEMDMQSAVEGATQAVSGITSMVGGVQGVISAFQAASDASLDSTERMKASLMGLGASIPMLIQGYQSLIGGIRTFAGVTNEATIAETLHGMKMKANNILGQFLTKTKMGQIIAEKLGIVVKTADTVATSANTGATAANTVATKNQTAANYELLVSMGPIMWIIMAIIAALAILVVSIIAITKSISDNTDKLVDNAAASEKDLEEKKALTEAAREEKQAIEDVTSAYEDLAKQYEDGAISIEELKTKTYDLCMQYDLEDLAVKALTSSYADLNEVMREAQIESDKALKASLEAEEDARNKNLAAQFAANNNADYGSRFDNGGKTIDISDFGDEIGWTVANAFSGGWSGTIREALSADSFGEGLGKVGLHLATAGMSSLVTGDSTEQKQTQELAETLKQFGVIVPEDGQIDAESFFKAASRNYDEMLTELQKLDADEAELLIKALADNKDEIAANTAAIKEQDELTKGIILAESYEEDDISSVIEYNTELERLTKELIKENETEGYYTGTEEEIREQAYADAEKFLRQFSNANKWQQQDKIIELLQGAKKQNSGNYKTTELATTLEDASLAERQFIQENIDLVVRYDSLDEALEEYKDTIAFMNSKNFAVEIKTILEDKEITQEKIDELYDNYTDFAEKTGIDKKTFEIMDYNEQTTATMNYYLKTQKAAIDTKDAVIAARKEELAAVTKEYEEAQEKQRQIKQAEMLNMLDDVTDTSKLVTKVEVAGDYAPYIEEKQFTMEDVYGMIDKHGATLSSMSDQEIQELGFTSKEYQEKLGFSEEDMQVLEAYLNTGNDAISNLKTYFNTKEEALELGTEEIESYENAIKSLKESIETAEAASITYAEHQEEFLAKLEANNDSIDSLQGSYSDLIDIVSEYNNQGFLTIDTMQKLINMDSDTLAALQWDKATNSLSLNTEYMKNNLVAKLEDTKATIQQEGTTKLLALATDDHSFSTRMNTLAQKLNADASLDAALTAQESAELWAEAASTIGGTSGEAALVVEETNKKLQMVQNTIDEIKKNPFSMITGDIIDPDDLDKLEDVLDRYWEINHVLSKIERTMEDLERIQSKLHGQELIDSLKTENKLIEEQNEGYKKLLEEQQEEADELEGKLSHLGVDFYDNGEIANYEQAMEEALNRYNAIAGSGNYSAETKEKAKEEYEKFKEYMERYDELYYEEMEDTRDKIEENKMAILENNLEAFEVELEVKLERQQFERDWNDFKKELDSDFTLEFENLDPTLEALQKNIGTYTSEDGVLQANLDAIKQVGEEILKLDAGEESVMFTSISEAQEKLKELVENSQSDALDLKDLYEEAWDTYIEGINQAAEKFEKITSEHERISEQLEYEQELIELIYGEEAYSKMNNLYKAQEQNTLAQVNHFKSQVDMWQEFYDNAEEGSADQARYYELLNEAQSSLNESLTTYIDLLKNDYLNTINLILQNFENGISNGSSFDDMSEEWEKMKEKSDKYFDSIESLYEVQKFANTMQMGINDTTSIKNQQKLQALYDKEIAYLKEKENLTQYDLDAAEARYQIALKEIALEDAQNAKNSMKLTRGADGNWSYQYVADQDDILAKQQDLSSSYNDLYQLANTAYEENLKSMVDLQQWYLEKGQEIASNDTLTEEQKQIKFDELRTQYLDKYKLLAEENTLYRNHLNEASAAMMLNIYNQDQTAYESMTEEEKALTDGLKLANITSFSELQEAIEGNYDGIQTKAETVMSETLDSWDSGAQSIADKWNKDDGESVKAQVTQSIDAMKTAWIEYQESVEIGAEQAGESVKNLGEDYSEVTSQVKELENATSNLVTKTKDQLTEYQSTIAGVKTAWGNVKENISTALTEAQKYFSYIGKFKGEDYNVPDPKNITEGNNDGYTTPPPLGSDGGSGDGGDNGDEKPTEPREINVMASSTGGTIRKLTLTEEQKNQYSIESNGNGVYSFRDKNTGSASYFINKDDYQYLKELGYTSNFGAKSSSPQYVNMDINDALKIGVNGYEYLGYGYKLRLKNGQTYTYMGITTPELTGLSVTEAISKIRVRENQKNLASLDTGGYTGDWGTTDGRLAVLHQKELVLNQADTKNILSAVQTVRDISSSLEAGIMNKLSAMIGGLSNLTQLNYNPVIADSGSSTENIFNITAEFPNADSVETIQAAILNLPNIASQYIAEHKK